MRRIRLVLEYDGTDFGGWQRQPNAPTIQAAVEDALTALTEHKVVIRGAGRTDAGVHALGQVAHFDTPTSIPLVAFTRGLNQRLPPSIASVAADEVAPDFDARFSARGKLYRYRIWRRDARSPHERDHSWHIPRALDLHAMRSAAPHLVGEHDFAAFRAADCERKTTERTVTRLALLEDGERLHVEIEANAFLKNMVRIIVGTLVEVGLGQRTPDDVRAIRDGRDRVRAGITAPARGLTMVRVFY